MAASSEPADWAPSNPNRSSVQRDVIAGSPLDRAEPARREGFHVQRTVLVPRDSDAAPCANCLRPPTGRARRPGGAKRDGEFLREGPVGHERPRRLRKPDRRQLGGQLDERDWIRGTAAEGYLRFVDLETGDLGETVSEGRSFTTRAAPGTAFRGSAVGPTAVASHSPHRRGWMLTRDPISMDGR